MTLVSTPGDPNADSYISLADANTYFTARGETTWTGSDSTKENALRRGTTYLDNQYRARWVGLTVTQIQALEWPRCDGMRGYYRGYTQLLLNINGFPIDQTIVPVQVQRAAAEAALLHIQGIALEPRLQGQMIGGIKRVMKKVDVLETDFEYGQNLPTLDRFTVIEGLLRGLVLSTPGSPTGTVQLLRA